MCYVGSDTSTQFLAVWPHLQPVWPSTFPRECALLGNKWDSRKERLEWIYTGKIMGKGLFQHNSRWVHGRQGKLWKIAEGRRHNCPSAGTVKLALPHVRKQGYKWRAKNKRRRSWGHGNRRIYEHYMFWPSRKNITLKMGTKGKVKYDHWLLFR